MTWYLVNNHSATYTSPMTMAYSTLEFAINHVKNAILYDDYFDSLSRKELEHACLEWVIKAESF